MDGSEEESPERSSTSRAPNTACVASIASLDASRNVVQVEEPRLLSFADEGGFRTCSSKLADEDSGEVSLREWLDKPERVVDLLECLHVFRQIVETVSLAHSQGVVVTNIRPSCFVISSLNRISFIESASCSSSSPNSSDHGSGGSEEKADGDEHLSLLEKKSERHFERFSDANCLRLNSDCAVHLSSADEVEKENCGGEAMRNVVEGMSAFPLKQILLREFTWYTSPEEAEGGSSSFASDIYRLGVLLFELFCTFESPEEKLRTMSNLRHRILPPQLLLKWPKQASFCLLLLHPQPDNRPKLDKVLQSEFLNEPKHELEEREAAIKLREEIEDQELLLEFLLQLQQSKQEAADKLHDAVWHLSADIEEVLNQHSVLNKKGDFNCTSEKDEKSTLGKMDHTLPCDFMKEYPASLGSRKRFRPELRNYSKEEHDGKLSQCPSSETHPENQGTSLSKSSRLKQNFKKLEAVYFSTRWRLMKPAGKSINKAPPVSSSGRCSISKTEGSSVHNLGPKEGHPRGKRSEWVNSFLDGLCKYLSFSEFKVRADLKQGGLLNSSSLVCSLGFDRDKELFATAGVNKKIKVFECERILDEDRDIHYPVVEMGGRSKLSSICWNGYIKSHIASSDFEGVVQVWDVTRGEALLEMREHERRVWSVDFSLADPTQLASGSDDGSVKLWNINQARSIGTIKTKANVCSVQFPPDSAYTIAIGSADHNIYCYDLRNPRIPYCSLIGHTKTVSYVKFLDSSTIVSASTDNTLKVWDLSLSASRVIDDPLQTFTGHTNVKNFVGLSISDEYIATGSETNEVFVYHKAFPMPVLSHKFNSTDPISGQEVDDGTEFISCVCWRGQTSTLLAANSSGNIKLLEMV